MGPNLSVKVRTLELRLCVKQVYKQIAQTIIKKGSTSENGQSLAVVKLHPGAQLLTRATAASAGLDIATYQNIILQPGEIQKVSTGISISLPHRTCGRLIGRSRNTINKMIDVKGGLIDADYTGEIKVLLHNFGTQPQHFHKGDRIAQLVME